MSINYCPKCGAPVATAGQVYCAKCGARLPNATVPARPDDELGERVKPDQPGSKMAEATDERASQPNTRPHDPAPTQQPFVAGESDPVLNLAAPVPFFSNKKSKRDLAVHRILAYKKAIGLAPTTDNIVLATVYAPVKMSAGLALKVFGPIGEVAHYALYAKESFESMRLLSFEDNGICVLSIDMKYNFTGKNLWIPASAIGGFRYRSVTPWGFMTSIFYTNGKTDRFTIPKKANFILWQHSNAQALAERFKAYQ